MKRYIKANTSDYDFYIELVVSYTLPDDLKLAASSELDLMDLSILDKQIVNFPEDKVEIDTNSEAYKNFIEFVNKVDELLELRKFEVLGESEKAWHDSESTYRGILINLAKTLSENHISGKIMHTLRLSGHKESRSSRRTRAQKLEDAANSEEVKALNSGNSAIVGEFESIRIKCTVSDPSKSKISNKEFYSYLDAIHCIDAILDNWDEL